MVPKGYPPAYPGNDTPATTQLRFDPTRAAVVVHTELPADEEAPADRQPPLTGADAIPPTVGDKCLP
jgi:hypothetical protein